MNSGKVTLWIVGFLIIYMEIFAQSVSPPELKRVPYKSHNEKELREYFLYLPYGYRSSSPDRKWPVIMFLHGNGERGNGLNELDWVMVHGPMMEAWVQKRDLPFIIISPQLPMYGMDTVSYIINRDPIRIPKRLDVGVPQREVETDMPNEMKGAVPASDFPHVMPPDGWERVADDLINMVNTVITNYQGDPDRVYLTGLSYGANGTWYMASKYPDVWAAINPIVGWGHPDLMSSIAEHHIPVWCIAGGRDPAYALKYYYDGINKLEALGNKEVLFTVHEDMGHDTWKRVYAGEDLYNWMLTHKKQ